MGAGQFDRYEIIRRLTSGGMGDIFLCRQTGAANFDRLVVIKTLRPDLIDIDDFAKQFLDEGRVVGHLNHPNVVSVFEVGETSETFYIAMEYIHGESVWRLNRVLKELGETLPRNAAALIARDAALGLDHAHHARDTDGQPLEIVHRDIDQRNIMVRLDGVSKVVDFGIARAARRAIRTETGLIKGKPQYMSPEQVAGLPLDGRSDQFSLGIVLWELACGRRLFEADTPLEALVQIQNKIVTPPSRVVSGFPADLEAVIMRMLEKEPGARYPRCGDVADALDDHLRQTGYGRQHLAELMEGALGSELGRRIGDLTPTGESTPLGGGAGAAERAADTLAVGTAANAGSDALGARPYAGLSHGSPVLFRSIALALVILGTAVVAWFAAGPAAETTAAPDSTMARAGSPDAVVLDIRGPAGAAVVINGKRWPQRAPVVITGLPPGPLRVRIEPDRVQAIERWLVVEVGEPIIIDEPLPAKQMVLDIRDPLGATVYVDDVRWPQAVPTIVTGLAPGPHEVRLELAGHLSIQRRIVVEVGEPIIMSEAAPASAATLEVRTTPVGASVLIGGRVVGTAPLDHVVPAGTVQFVSVERPGFVTQSMHLTLSPGEVRRLQVPLLRVDGARRRATVRNRDPRVVELVVERIVEKEADFGYLTLQTEPWTKVSIDGRPWGSTPLYRVELRAGERQLRLRNEEARVDEERMVRIEPNRTTKLNLRLTPP